MHQGLAKAVSHRCDFILLFKITAVHEPEAGEALTYWGGRPERDEGVEDGYRNW